ncbi:hypothetical protein H072_5167 [Dactylellina haptotyla CBS 200.50]|uniref:Uncharacterized protein n=1 Tax=Dactylellina haptotyla (strain CBS 200.50) TaxID=1284197 RepID=S8AII3_DACHA|nr:hypothetical protein H072_5167 [Dactylellina haptotyla CBS 200.50]
MAGPGVKVNESTPFNPNWESLAQTIVNRQFEQIALLHWLGARNFLVLTTHLRYNSTVQKSWILAVKVLNDAIKTKYNEFKDQLEVDDSQFWYYDTNGVFDQALDNPTAYGALDVVCYNRDGVSCL